MGSVYLPRYARHEDSHLLALSSSAGLGSRANLHNEPTEQMILCGLQIKQTCFKQTGHRVRIRNIGRRQR